MIEPALKPVLNRDAALERLGGDTELLEELLVMMVEESREHLDQIRAALARGDAAAVNHAAHTIKGSAANLEALGVVEAALALEMAGRGGDLAAAAGALARLESELARFAAALDASVPSV